MADDCWKEVVKDIKPLKNKKIAKDVVVKDVKINHNKDVSVVFDALVRGKPVKKDDYTQMDGALARKFKREEIKVEAVLDLHGVKEKDAHDKVLNFIKSCYNNQKRCVLIITGKGISDDPFSGKGILKKSVPGWLYSDDVGSLILAYKNPSEALGGAGALYILLRKKL
jgi:DNA-nicking Smr family endonuclease